MVNLKVSEHFTIGCSFYLLMLWCTQNLCPKFHSTQSFETPRQKATVKQIMFPYFIVVFAIHITLQCIKTPSSAFMLQHSTRHPVNHPSKTHQKEKFFLERLMEVAERVCLIRTQWKNGFSSLWLMIVGCQDAAQHGMLRHGVERQAMMRVQAWRAVPSSLREQTNQPGDSLTNLPTNQPTNQPADKGKPMPAKSGQPNHTTPAAM